MSKKTRRNFSPEEKVKILREHLVDHMPVSEICDKHKLNVNVFYRWQSEFFQSGHKAFEKDKKVTVSQERKIEKLENTISDRNNAIAELISDNLELKKNLGED